MSLLTDIREGDIEGVKWAKLQRWLRLACDNAGISYSMSYPLTDINPGDTEGVKWAKLGAWMKLLAENITGGGGGGQGTLLTTFDFVGTAVLDEIFGYFAAPAEVTLRRIQISAQQAPSGGDIVITLVDGSGVSLGVTATLADGQTFQETVLGAPLVIAASDVVRAKLTTVDGTGGYLTVNLL